MLRASVEKLTTWKGPFLSSPLSSEMPLLTEGHVMEGSANKRYILYYPYGSPSCNEESRRTQSCRTQTTLSHILPNQSLHSLEQARCCLKWLPCLARWHTHSPLTMRPQHYPPLWCTRVNPSYYLSAACASRRTYVPSRSAARRLINRLLPSRSELPAISRTLCSPRVHINFPSQWSTLYKTRKTIWVLSYRPPPYVSPLPVAGVFWVLSPWQSGILPRRRQLLLPSINTEEMLKFLVDMEKGEIT